MGAGTGVLPEIASKTAKKPFYFNSAAHLLRIGRERATTLAELLEGIRTCPDNSIFQHMFQTLEEHHFIEEGFSNDFAHWAFAACNEVGLAERLASIDVRTFTSISALRGRVVEVFEEYLVQNPRAKDRAGFEPFYFCATDTVVIPTKICANNLPEFLDGMNKITVQSIHYHFIDARLRLKLSSNDFSVWLDEEMGLRQAANRVNRIDIYTLTLEDVRKNIIKVLENTLNGSKNQEVKPAA